ncbi:hypothetical protein EON63_20840 [archaeon]|nr:MAG: hypothetical protein EON63_20840 [archaeon]
MTYIPYRIFKSSYTSSYTSHTRLVLHTHTHTHIHMQAQSLTSPSIHMQKLFYPKWWLDTTGYFTHPPNKGEGVILFAPQPEGYVSRGEAYMYMGMAVVMTVLLPLR